jgi:hypothetical protein
MPDQVRHDGVDSGNENHMPQLPIFTLSKKISAQELDGQKTLFAF